MGVPVYRRVAFSVEEVGVHFLCLPDSVNSRVRCCLAHREREYCEFVGTSPVFQADQRQQFPPESVSILGSKVELLDNLVRPVQRCLGVDRGRPVEVHSEFSALV